MTRVLTFVAAFVTIAAAAPRVQTQEPGSATVVPVSVNGDPAKRFSLVVMSDGYSAADMPKYRAHLDKHLNVLWSIEPFRSYRNYINVYSVEIVSAESGITCDPEIRQQKKTPLGANFTGGCENPNARGILVNQEAARAFAKRATPDFDQILVIANTDTYGGIGGGVATTSGGNSLGPLITPHEIGHSLGRLQDEYTYRERGVAGGAYKGEEPTSVHHTLLTEEQMRADRKKWFRWLGDESESGGKIGRFEGGQYTTTGVWRPSKHSMMISIGYHFDQVSRERMVQRISEQVSLIADSTPTEAPVRIDETVWIETPHPNYHELSIKWTVDGKEVRLLENRPYLPLYLLRDSQPGILPDAKTVTVTVTDPTPFVRDPAIRAAALTATRSWTIAPNAPRTTLEPLKLTGSTPTDKPVGGTDVLYVSTSAGRPPTIVWRLNEAVIPGESKPTLNLARLFNLPRKTSKVSATIAATPTQREQRREWIVDNTTPTVKYTIGTPLSMTKSVDGTPHYTVREEFTLKLEPTDDQPGYVVAEFRVNGDGWHHYYGWPDAPPGTPYKFTPRGTTIKELVYGSLSSEGLSPQPWEKRDPGYGTHRIELRAIDAAGNVGPVTALTVTVER